LWLRRLRIIDAPPPYVRSLLRCPPGTNVIVVTHKPNILDAFGKDWFDVREGEASVFKPDGNGGYKPIVRIQAGAWSEFAQDADSFLNLYDLN
jgi:hypothetical protein